MRFKMKPGMGKHYPDIGTVIRPGDILNCEPFELGRALHKFEQLDPDPPEPEPTTGLHLVHRSGPWYDVMNAATGKNINDRALHKADAEALVEDFWQRLDTAVLEVARPRVMMSHEDNDQDTDDTPGNDETGA